MLLLLAFTAAGPGMGLLVPPPPGIGLLLGPETPAGSARIGLLFFIRVEDIRVNRHSEIARGGVGYAVGAVRAEGTRGRRALGFGKLN